MKLPRRPILLALLALAAPMSALAVSGNDGGPQALSVSTSLAGCGTSSSQVVCELNVSFNQLDNADSYTASVTRADGSVVDYGSVPAGGTSLFVPYVGAGSYTVTITAYGDPEEEGEPKEEVAKETSEAEAGAGKESKGEAQLDATEAEDGGEEDKPAAIAPAGGDGPAAEACVEQPAPNVPPEPVKPPADTDPANPDEDADGIDDATEAGEYERLVAEREQALEAAEQAAASDCP